MNITEAISLQAFLNVLGQLDSLPPELVLTLNRIGYQLETNPNGAISELVKLANKSPLKERYPKERDRLDPNADPNSSKAEISRGPARPKESRPQTEPDYIDNATVDSFDEVKAIGVGILSAVDPVEEAKQKERELKATDASLLGRLA